MEMASGKKGTEMEFNHIDLRNAGDVERYHAYPTLQRQTVAAHTWNVIRIWCELYGPPDQNDIMALMFHDCAEIITGDIPFPFKKELPEKELSEAEEKITRDLISHIKNPVSRDPKKINHIREARVKVCDLIEMAEFGIKEMELGNRKNGGQIYTNIMRALNVHLEHNGNLDFNPELKSKINELYKRADKAR